LVTERAVEVLDGLLVPPGGYGDLVKPGPDVRLADVVGGVLQDLAVGGLQRVCRGKPRSDAT
jgi:hypothetical protein